MNTRAFKYAEMGLTCKPDIGVGIPIGNIVIQVLQLAVNCYLEHAERRKCILLPQYKTVIPRLTHPRGNLYHIDLTQNSSRRQDSGGGELPDPPNEEADSVRSFEGGLTILVGIVFFFCR